MNPPAGREEPLAPVTRRVWSILQASRGGRFAGDTYKGLRAVIHGFRGERIRLRAAALTYISIFSLVPLLTVALVLIQSLHRRPFQTRLLQFMHAVFAPGIRDESAALFERFIDRASAVTAGSVGFLLLMLSAGSLLMNLDGSINEIWGVRRTRPWHIRLLSYAAILLFGPVLLAITLVGTASLRTMMVAAHVPWSRELFALGTLVVAIATFTTVYLVTPNAPVKPRSALAGGLVAGVGWELARFSYAGFGEQIFRYNPVYGSLGEAPLFLAWIYASWLIVLFGARLSYAVEYASFQGTFRALGEAHPRAKELVACQMAQRITQAHFQALTPPTVKELARRLEVPEQTVQDLADRLELAGLIAVGRHGGLHPAKHPDELTIAELSAAVGGVIGLVHRFEHQGENAKEFSHLEALFARLDHATVEKLAGVTWSSLMTEEPTVAPPAPAPTTVATTASGGRNP
ncbi:MAG TPA: YhjD/YihY/BrkB family envelope integrity protein [Myxococcaceae bacterium]|nr:YhjD/YihY/BrkB family envelope integrity protein [Myxococcaceae bacterium]